MLYNENEYLDNNEELKKILMKTAFNFADLSKCAAKKVCCLLYKNGNIISIGINGSLPGTINCCDKFKKINGIWYTRNYKVPDAEWEVCEDQEQHHKWSSFNEVHAEVNAVTKTLVPIEDSTVFITHSPCRDCAKLLAISGVRRIYYNIEYDDFYTIKEFLSSKGIDLIRVVI